MRDLDVPEPRRNAEVDDDVFGVLDTIFHHLQPSDAMSSSDQPLTPPLSPPAGRGSE
jgi:hypothetical protein